MKLLLGIAVAVLAVVCIWLFIPQERLTGISIEPSGLVVQNGREGAVRVSYGWSVKDDATEAVQEVVARVGAQLGGWSPDYVMLFSTVGYDSEQVLGEVRRLLPEAKIYGGTSCLGVLTRDGFHVGETGSLALLGISSPKISFGVGGADLDKLTAREAGKVAIQAAIQNAGQAGLPQLVLMTAAPGKEEEILLGVEDVIGRDIPVIGGSSGDNDISGKWRQFANDRVYSNGVSLAAIYTDLTVGWAFEAGYLRTENRGLVTKAAGRVIYEIGGKPAAEIYNDWTNGIISDELETGGTVLSKTTYHPLAKIIRGKDGETHYLSIHPLSVDLPARSLTVFANVDEGDELLLMHGNWELLLNRAQTTPHKAHSSKNIARGEGAFGLYTYCAGTMLAIPEEERPKIPLLVNYELGNIPFIGTFTFGEQGFLQGVGNRHGNLVNSMIVFAEKQA